MKKATDRQCSPSDQCCAFGGRPECGDAVYSQLDELLHLLLSEPRLGPPAIGAGLPLPPDAGKRWLLCFCVCVRLRDARVLTE